MRRTNVPDFPLERDQVSAEMATLYDKIFALRGNVQNIFRGMAQVCLSERGEEAAPRKAP
jgi:hypothetical protein